MSKPIDAIGHIYGRLTVLSSLGIKGRKQFVLTQCTCGKQFESCLSNLRSGNTTSCGCFRVEATSGRAFKHGFRNTLLYRAYASIVQRCYNPKNHNYFRYGGRGIVMCDFWREDFSNFAIWAQNNGYIDGLQIDRIDVDKGYSHYNCRWVDQTIQARNRRTRKHSSKYTGVYWHTYSNKWRADITVNKKRVYLGSFEEETKAWQARCDYIHANNLTDFQTNSK